MTILTILQHHFKRKMTRKANFLITLLLPVIVVILGIAANAASKPSFTIGILSPEPDIKSQQIIDTLKKTSGIAVENATPLTLKTDLITGRYFAVIEFSAGGYHIRSIKDQQTTDRLSSMIEQYAKNPTPADIDPLFQTSLGMPQRICAFMVLFLMISATMNASLITKNRISGTLRRIKLSPCSATSYVAGSVIFNSIITYFQFFIAVSLVQLIQLNTGISYGNYLLMGVWITLFSTAFGTCMAFLFRQEMQVNLFAACFAVLLSLLGGTFIALEKMPPMLQKISVISPIRWFIHNVNGMVQGQSWLQGTQSVLILSLFIAALFIMAAIRNRAYLRQ